MGCIKNPKSFLGIKYEGRHDWKIDYVSKFIPTSDTFILHSHCELCGCHQRERFLTWEELLHRGVSNEEIEKADRKFW